MTRSRAGPTVLLTLLPWPAVWLGLYGLNGLAWTFILYHGLCLLPAAALGWREWAPGLRWPTRREALVLVCAAAAAAPLTVVAYRLFGAVLIDRHALLFALASRGFRPGWLIPLTCYFVVVNGVLEELFWRGVILRRLRGSTGRAWTPGAAWTAITFSGWHYLALRILLRPGWAEACLILILAAGIFLDWLYRTSRTIVLPILWHALVMDLPVMVVLWCALGGGYR